MTNNRTIKRGLNDLIFIRCVMSDQGENEGYIQQLGGLTASVSRHEETLNSLKGVPSLLNDMASVLGLKTGDRRDAESTSSQVDDHSSLFDGSHSDVDFVQKMMNCSNQNDQEKFDEPDLDEELKLAFQDCEKGLDVGPPVHRTVAEAFNRTVKRPLSKETLTDLTSKMKIPENCQLSVPKVNTEIWGHLSNKTKICDLNWQSLQHNIAYALTNLAVTSNLISSKVGTTEISTTLASQILRANMDAANMLGYAMQQINNKRKAEIKPFLNADFAGICSSSVPVTDFLFGNDLKETLKNSKTESMVMKQTFTRRNFRGKPYDFRATGPTPTRNYNSQQSTPASLNRPRPLWRPPRRGSGSNYHRQFPASAQLPNQYRRQV